MTLRLSQIGLFGCLAASLGCQNPLNYSNQLAERSPLQTRISLSSDDPAAMESGGGHLPSLASELADNRPRNDQETTGKSTGGSSLKIEQLIARGHEADAHGQAREAKTCYEQILAKEPGHPEAHHRLAILADHAGDYSTAEEHYQTALAGKPDDPDLLNDLGYSYFLQGRASDSERILERARRLSPQHAHVQENLSLLYDRAKAEKVLKSMMGPRQTQATLARLFQHAPGGHAVPDQMALTAGQSSREKPANDLQRKMEEARFQGLVDHQQQIPPSVSNPHANRVPSPPPLPTDDLPHFPQRGQSAPAAEVAIAPAGDGFQRLNATAQVPTDDRDHVGMSSQRTANDPRTANPHSLAEVPASSDQWNTLEQRPQAPQWNTPPQSWPQITPGISQAHADIELAKHSLSESVNPAPQASPASITSAAQRAAEIGMAVGPGAMFPSVDDSLSQAPASNGQFHPAASSQYPAPGHQQPGAPNVPPQWKPQPAPGDWGQPAPPRNQLDQHEAYAPHAAPPSRFSQDQKPYAGTTGHMMNVTPQWEPLPGPSTSHQPSRPAHRQEPSNPYHVEINPAPTQPATAADLGQFPDQNPPPYNPAPQNEGRRW